MKLKIVAVGKINHAYLVQGIQDYLKRLTPYAQIELIEVKESTTNDITKNMLEEKQAILTALASNDYIVTLEIDGKPMDSIAFSEWIYQHYTYSHQTITFVIGGSNGLDNEIKQQSRLKLSFGAMTYPHQLIRLMLCEQLYRAVMIRENRPYHK